MQLTLSSKLQPRSSNTSQMRLYSRFKRDYHLGGESDHLSRRLFFSYFSRVLVIVMAVIVVAAAKAATTTTTIDKTVIPILIHNSRSAHGGRLLAALESICSLNSRGNVPYSNHSTWGTTARRTTRTRVAQFVIFTHPSLLSGSRLLRVSWPVYSRTSVITEKVAGKREEKSLPEREGTSSSSRWFEY